MLTAMCVCVCVCVATAAAMEETSLQVLTSLPPRGHVIRQGSGTTGQEVCMYVCMYVCVCVCVCVCVVCVCVFTIYWGKALHPTLLFSSR